MLSSKLWITVAVVVVIAAVSLCGCGGGGGGVVAPTTGSVTGHIEDFSQQVGLGGVTVRIGGQQGVTNAAGDFRVDNIAPGTYPVVIIPPAGSGLVLPTDSPIPPVTVLVGDTTPLGTTIILMDENDQPPGPPTS